MKKTSIAALILILIISLLSACGKEKEEASGSRTDVSNHHSGDDSKDSDKNSSGKSDDSSSNDTSDDSSSQNEPKDPEDQNSNTPQEDTQKVDANPENVSVLVNKQYALPEDYEPKDLVFPDVPFTFSEKIDKRKMRKEAASALEKMFAGAEQDGIHLAGVSAYRSHAAQKALFNRYVQKDGLEKAKTYSAEPGHSEHETGLAVDLSGSDGKCAAEDCFGGTAEAKWIAEHASDYGFIIRYPEGKESITGYQYEPWHIRYVGTKLAKELAAKGITLEEYYNAIPVSK